MRSGWCVAILAVGVAQAQQRQPGQGINFYSKDKEIALGQRLAQDVRQRTTPLDSAAVNDYVKRVGARLAAQFPDGWPFTFETVREHQDGATDEPLALPGGPIFIPADLIPTARTEAEFAGMLAHAMAHVVARHYTRDATRAELIMQTAPLPVSEPPTATPIGMIAIRRADEREADYWAVKAMAAAGYDPAGLASYLERVQPGKHNVTDTLPPRNQRVAAIRSEIRTLPAGDYHASDEFDRVQAEVKRLR